MYWGIQSDRLYTKLILPRALFVLDRDTWMIFQVDLECTVYGIYMLTCVNTDLPDVAD